MPNTPFTSAPRAPIWRDIPDEQWFDARWQLSQRINSAAELGQVLELTPAETEALHQQGLFRVDITPYFASLIRPNDPTCPIRRQVIPVADELHSFTGMMADSLGEDADSPVRGLVHRYPDRVLMLVTTQCASYCRYCTRSRIVGDATHNFSQRDFEAQIAYIAAHPEIRDVLLSGGDPLILPLKLLDSILGRLRAIPHVEIIRMSTRIPVFLPMLITAELCEVLAKHHPFWLNIHVNHPSEITAELAEACDRLSRAGIPLGNQAVLLAGVNDCVHIQRRLVHDLVRMRVRPYYLYQCDLVTGAGHFRTPIGKGIEIIESLRGHTSGYAVPTFVVDGPNGEGKIPLMPNYVVSYSANKVVLRNYEGHLTVYEEPAVYNAPCENGSCPECVAVPGRGVAGLMGGRERREKREERREKRDRGKTEPW